MSQISVHSTSSQILKSACEVVWINSNTHSQARLAPTAQNSIGVNTPVEKIIHDYPDFASTTEIGFGRREKRSPTVYRRKEPVRW